MNEKFVLKIAGHSATLKEEPTGSKDTGIFLPPELLEFLGGMEKLSFIIYKEDCVAAMASIIVSLPLYSNKSGNKVSHDSILETYFSYLKAINEFFGTQTTAKYEGFKPSITTQNRCYLYGLDKGNFSIRKFLIADYSTLTFIKKEDNTIDLRFKTNVISERQAPLPIENSIADFETKVINDDKTTKLKAPPIPTTQIIYYGVPGCGKSYKVEKDIDKELNKHNVENKEYHKVRCVFHPEYSNADFVGQVYPFVDPDGHGVDYRFKPGPFADVVRRAYHEPNKPFFLIIEEINRGNAAAIFGEMFQLLDRIKPGDNPDKSTENIYQPGWSSYGVSNTDVNAYIRQKTTDEEEIRAKRQNKESLFESEINFQRDDCAHVVVNNGARDKQTHELHFTWTTAIRLPPNLSIYATMNTSDQNVITMDNAFQRRFKSRMIRNDLDNVAQYNIKIEGTNVCWGAFRKWVNEKILSTPNISKADDKCLGGWFISTSVKRENNVTKFEDVSRVDFAEKVIKYLWDDVFKRNAATVIFKKGSGNDEFKSLSELIDAFENETGQMTEAFDKVFKLSDDDKRNLIKDINGVSQQDDLAGEGSMEGETVADA